MLADGTAEEPGESRDSVLDTAALAGLEESHTISRTESSSDSSLKGNVCEFGAFHRKGWLIYTGTSLFEQLDPVCSIAKNN